MLGVLTRLSCPSYQPVSRRNLSLLQNLARPPRAPSLLDKSRHRIVYDFRYVGLQAAFLRLKYSLPVLGTIAAPVVWYWTGSAVTAGGFLVSCLLQIGIIMRLARALENTVGKVYVDRKNSEEVLFSSLDLYGRRVDRIHNKTDLVTADFMNGLQRAIGIITVAVPKADLRYKLNVKSCVLHDKEACFQLFGDLVMVNAKKK